MVTSSAVELAALAAVGAGAAAVISCAAMLPEPQLFGRTLIAGNDAREVALTFDDGPNPRCTPALLDLLAEYEVRATFFMIGRFVRAETALARRVHAAGHLVGNHTFTHPWLAWQSAARVREELRSCNEALEDALGERVRVFRPPHGARRPVVMRAARELGLATVQWNGIGQDWTGIGGAEIVRILERRIARAERMGRGSNLVLHDGSDVGLNADRAATLAAVEEMVVGLPARGKRFVTVDAWL